MYVNSKITTEYYIRSKINKIFNKIKTKDH